MSLIGYSTGTIALGDFRLGLEKLRGRKIKAVELSALREGELKRLVEVITDLDLKQFNYISFHAPSRINTLTENELISYLDIVADLGMPIILHPNVISDYNKWKHFGSLLCIENMDKRKPVARTVEELEMVFSKLPDASFCLDIGHSRQIDTTMNETLSMLRNFESILKQVHLSEVDSASKHQVLSAESFYAFAEFFYYFNRQCPIILETPAEDLMSEIEKVKRLLDQEFISKLYRTKINPVYDYN